MPIKQGRNRRLATGKNTGPAGTVRTGERERLNRRELSPRSSPVLFFRKILNFSKDTVIVHDKRGAPRYTVGHPFPFKCIVTLIEHDGEGKPIPSEVEGQDWSGRLCNVSATGASVQMHSAAMAIRGEPCRFKLSLDGYLLEIPCTIAHFHCYPQHVLCGVTFKFPDFNIKKAFLQLLEPVSIGATLEPVDAKKVRQNTPELHKEEFRNEGAALLTVWRKGPGGEIQSFDFRMNNYGVRWSAGLAELETYGVSEAKRAGKKGTAPPLHLTEVQQEEVRWLFCLAVPNLPNAVPADVRKFLGQLVA
jgi:hypothetical protein